MFLGNKCTGIDVNISIFKSQIKLIILIIEYGIINLSLIDYVLLVPIAPLNKNLMGNKKEYTTSNICAL